MYIKFDAVLFYRMVICVEHFSVGIYKYINEEILFFFLFVFVFVSIGCQFNICCFVADLLF